jgi:hypothetical protein
LTVTDKQIREKLRFFETSVGTPDSHVKAHSSSWLEKFKVKNGLSGNKSRKNSVADDSEAASNPESGVQTPTISPTSPPVPRDSPGAMSITKDENDVKPDPENFNDFAPGHKPYASIGSALTDSSHPFSPDPTSPTSPYFGDTSPFSHQGNGFQRPRSQTFPITNADPGTYASPPSSEALTPKYVTSTSLEASLISSGPADSVISSITSSRMSPADERKQLNALGLSLPLTPPPGSPSLEDTRRAMEVVMNFFQSQPTGLVEPQDFVVMGKLMEKLTVRRSHSGEMPGGMHRISEGNFTGRE